MDQITQAMLATFAPQPPDGTPRVVDASNPYIYRDCQPGEIIAISFGLVGTDGTTAAGSGIYVEVGDSSADANPARGGSKAYPASLAAGTPYVIVFVPVTAARVAARRQLTTPDVPVYGAIWPVGRIARAGQ